MQRADVMTDGLLSLEMYSTVVMSNGTTTSFKNLIPVNYSDYQGKMRHKQLKNYYLNIEKALSIIPVILMIAGTLGNMLALYVLTRRKLRTQSTMLYFASLTIIDTISLYQWNFNFFYRYQLSSQNQNLEDMSLFLCRYISFMAYFSMEASAWILAIITVDRYLILVNNRWKQKYSKNIKFNLSVIMLVVGIAFMVNMPVAMFNGEQLTSETVPAQYKTEYNFTTRIMPVQEDRIRRNKCYSNWFMQWYQKAALMLECVLPLIIMITFNSLLIKRTYKSTTRLVTPGGKRANANRSLANIKNYSASLFNQPPTQHKLGIDSSKFESSHNKTTTKYDDEEDEASFFISNNKPSVSNLSQMMNDGETGTSSKDESASFSNNQNTNEKRLLSSGDTFFKESLMPIRRTVSLKRTTFKLHEDSEESGTSEVKKSFNRHTSLKYPKNNIPSSPKLTVNGAQLNLDEPIFTLGANNNRNGIMKHHGLNKNPNARRVSIANRNSPASSVANLSLSPVSKPVFNRHLSDSGEEKTEYKLPPKIRKSSTTNQLITSPKLQLSSMNDLTSAAAKETAAAASGQVPCRKASSFMYLNWPGSPRNGPHASNNTIALFNGGSGAGNNSVSSKKVSNIRNKRIVVMLSLLTLSFTISTLPSSIFYTFFRPILNDKPYKSLLSMSFILLRHLSHAFNFIIYFTSSSVIKQQLREIFREDLNLRNYLRQPNLLVNKCSKLDCCCCGFSSLKSKEDNRKKSAMTTKSSSNEFKTEEQSKSRHSSHRRSRNGHNHHNPNHQIHDARHSKTASNNKRRSSSIVVLKPIQEGKSPTKKSTNSKAFTRGGEETCDEEKIINQSFKRKMHSLRQSSMISLNSMSSLSDLQSYYSVSKNFEEIDSEMKSIIRFKQADQDYTSSDLAQMSQGVKRKRYSPPSALKIPTTSSATPGGFDVESIESNQLVVPNLFETNKVKRSSLKKKVNQPSEILV